MTLQKLENTKTGEMFAETMILSIFKDNPNLNWAKLLCKNGECLDEFLDILLNTESLMASIMKYRRKVRQQGQSSVSIIELNNAYEKKQHNKLHSLLEVLFLEPIAEDQFTFIINRINTKEKLYKLYMKHNENVNTRVMYVVMTI